MQENEFVKWKIFSALLGQCYKKKFTESINKYLITRVFWLNIAISNLNQYYRYYLNLIGKLRREKEFRQQCCRNSTKIGERKRKSGREKAEEFRQHCYRNSFARNAARSVKKKAIAATPLPKKEKKNIVLTIVAMPLPKMEKKKIMKSVNE